MKEKLAGRVFVRIIFVSPPVFSIQCYFEVIHRDPFRISDTLQIDQFYLYESSVTGNVRVTCVIFVSAFSWVVSCQVSDPCNPSLDFWVLIPVWLVSGASCWSHVPMYWKAGSRESNECFCREYHKRCPLGIQWRILNSYVPLDRKMFIFAF